MQGITKCVEAFTGISLEIVPVVGYPCSESNISVTLSYSWPGMNYKAVIQEKSNKDRRPLHCRRLPRITNISNVDDVYLKYCSVNHIFNVQSYFADNSVLLSVPYSATYPSTS